MPPAPHTAINGQGLRSGGGMDYYTFGHRRAHGVASLDPDYDLAIGTYTAIWPRYERAGLDALTRPERAVFLAWQFVGEVNNGGLRQFLCNPSGAHAAETPAALDEVGMPHAAALLARALAAGGPPWFPCSAALDALTDEFFGSPEDPYELLASYVRRHSQELPSPVGS
jgi:hypothetical protein